ncbi:MAG: hypothetical protein CUN57_02095, partial [Phototrophicales bacterium]
MDWDLCITSGSQSAMSSAFDLLLNKGDGIIVERPTYSGALAALRKLNPQYYAIDLDEDGLQPAQLSNLLDNFAALHPNKTKPRVLYTIPTGQNPSGTTISQSRR